MNSAGMFKLHKIDTAPKGSERKAWDVSIQVTESGSRHGAVNVIGRSCNSAAELEELKDLMIEEIQALKFPAS